MAARAVRFVGLGLLAALVFATARVQTFVSRPYLHTNLYLPSGKFVEQASLGYRELAADLVWFQAVQYFGGFARSEHDLLYFNGLIDIVNELDPHFVFPYIFGAVVMAQDMGDLNRGVTVLKRGMRSNPEVYELPFEIGFLYYTVARNDSSAAQYFDLASRLPGGKDRGGRFAAFVYSKAGHLETSVRMWEEIARDTDQPYMRDLAKHYIEKLQHEAATQGDDEKQGDAHAKPPVTGKKNDI